MTDPKDRPVIHDLDFAQDVIITALTNARDHICAATAARRAQAEQVAVAHRLLADPTRSAGRDGLVKSAWSVLITAQGRTPCQSRMGWRVTA